MIELRQPLAVFANRIPWTQIESALAPAFARKNRHSQAVAGSDLFGTNLQINHHGELLSINVRPGNVDDRKPVAFLCHRLCGQVDANKGYVSQWLVDLLRARQITYITKVRKNGTGVLHSSVKSRKLLQKLPISNARVR